MSDASLSFTGSRILVLGAGGGIGAATVTAFAHAGGTVIGSDRPDAPGVPDGMVDLVPGDLAEPRCPAWLVQQVWHRHGPLDVLVHAAGLYPATAALDVTEDLVDRVLAVNTRSALLTAVALARLCRASGRGAAIVFVSSGAGQRPRPGTTVYAASKAALDSVTRSLALELGGDGIRVNAVAPGLVDVQSPLNPLPQRYVETVSDATPLGRAATTDDITPTILWLSHPASGWVTGQVVAADGGTSLGSPDAASWLS
jgi:3-oxoacyl-[acyl-carrier protein] reductase